MAAAGLFSIGGIPFSIGGIPATREQVAQALAVFRAGSRAARRCLIEGVRFGNCGLLARQVPVPRAGPLRC
jgi:hypothetical protein